LKGDRIGLGDLGSSSAKGSRMILSKSGHGLQLESSSQIVLLSVTDSMSERSSDEMIPDIGVMVREACPEVHRSSRRGLVIW
jgi:hypothetical protein